MSGIDISDSRHDLQKALQSMKRWSISVNKRDSKTTFKIDSRRASGKGNSRAAKGIMKSRANGKKDSWTPSSNLRPFVRICPLKTHTFGQPKEEFTLLKIENKSRGSPRSVPNSEGPESISFLKNKMGFTMPNKDEAIKEDTRLIQKNSDVLRRYLIGPSLLPPISSSTYEQHRESNVDAQPNKCKKPRQTSHDSSSQPNTTTFRDEGFSGATDAGVNEKPSLFRSAAREQYLKVYHRRMLHQQQRARRFRTELSQKNIQEELKSVRIVEEKQKELARRMFEKSKRRKTDDDGDECYMQRYETEIEKCKADLEKLKQAKEEKERLEEVRRERGKQPNK